MNDNLCKKIQELELKISALQNEIKYHSYYVDVIAIQNLMARYIYILERGHLSDVWDDLFVHDDERVRVEIMDSGAYNGIEHVKRIFYTMAGQMDVDGNPVDPASIRKGKMANTNSDRAALLLMLTISTPRIVVEPDGMHACGHWHFFGPHTNRVFDPKTKCKQDTAFWIAGKYDNEFVKVHGQWKILKLHSVGWLRTPYDKSWLEVGDCRRTPSPYWPPDEPPCITAFNPDAPMNPDVWAPYLLKDYDYHLLADRE